VSVGGISLTGLGLSEAKGLLEREFQNYAEHDIVLRYGDRIWHVSPRELGITYDATATSENAYRVGREGDILGQLEVQGGAILSGYQVPASRRFDEGVATMYLSKLARDINQPSRDPSLKVDGFRVYAEAGRPGRELDIAATKANLKAAFDHLSDEPIDLVVRSIEPADIDVETAQRQAENALSGPLVLTFKEQNVVSGTMTAQVTEKRWSLDQAVLAAALVPRQMKQPDGRVLLEMGVDASRLTPYIERLASQINRPPRDARLDFNPKTGRITPLVASQEGYALDITKTLTLINEQATSADRTIRLPVQITRPAVAVENVAEMGIKELITEATTYFKGSSEARIHNIRLAASRFDGVVIAPGEIFSFNNYLGEVSGATGYEEGQIIWGDRTAIGMGGGVCQVSTTVFRAAFWAGLPILERQNHGYRVSWYEPPVGLDATVYGPTVDLKFKNDMSHYILIKTATDLKAATVTVRFYGTSQGRVIEMSGPTETNPVKHGPAVYTDDPKLPLGTEKQVEFAHDGVDVTILRTVREGRQVILQDRFFSRYEPWPAMYLRGTKGKSTQ
jgi:vancomycin resistance protein YoaR